MREYRRHILVEADYLLERSASLTADAFRTEATLQRAFVRSLEVIGEAAKKVPPDFRDQHPEIEWRAMADRGDCGLDLARLECTQDPVDGSTLLSRGEASGVSERQIIEG